MGAPGRRHHFAALIALSLGACSGGAALEYMRKEYGSAQRDGVVDLSETGDPSQMYQIWVHKTKPKVNVQTSIKAAADYGIAQGGSYGLANTAPVQPTFQTAAERFLKENNGPDCRVFNPVKLHDIVWEFDYDCSPPPAPTRPKRARP